MTKRNIYILVAQYRGDYQQTYGLNVSAHLTMEQARIALDAAETTETPSADGPDGPPMYHEIEEIPLDEGT